MTSAPRRSWMRLQWRVHRFLWDLSRGRLLRNVLGMPVLELVTTGHKSGRERSILINYVATSSGYALAGTNAGAEWDPAWVKNLRSNPRARVRVEGAWRDVVARWPDANEHEALWERFVEANEGYAEYERMLERAVPLVVLE